MSALSRTCLRLAACAALRDATMAGAEVYDTRIGELPSFDPETARPVLTVYTEEQTGDALARQNGGPPFLTTVSLVLELAMMVAQHSNDDDTFVVGYPSTTADLEANLDWFEAQCRLALFESMSAHARAFRSACIRIVNVSSVRFAQVDAQDRAALRYVTYTVEVPDDPLVSFDASLVGLDRLPKTFREVASAWAEDAPERAVALKLAEALAQPTAPLLVAFRVNPANDPPATGPVENWTPPAPEPPEQIDGPPYSADWNMQP